ncbi:sensor histidine kinase [Bacillus taeanensis]|nr:sensor histidine kinase [Bacillus taeanensis]
MRYVWKETIRKYFLFSFKSTILSLFLPVIIIFIGLTGLVSYMLASSQIEDNAYTNTQDTVFQTKSILENKLSDAFEQLVALANDPAMLSVIVKEPSEIKPEDYIEVDKQLNRIYSNSNSIIDSILVDIHQGEFVLAKSEYQVGNITVDYEKYYNYNNYKGSKEGYYWRNLHQNNISSQNNSEVISVFKRIGKEDAKVQGLILFNLNKDFFENALNKSLIGENGYLALVNKRDYLTFKSVDREYQLDDTVLQYMSSLEEENGRLEFQKPGGEKMLVIYDTIGVNKWKVAAVFPEKEILKKINYIKYVTFMIVMTLIIIAGLLASFLAKYISNPLTSLVKEMNKINEDNFEVKLKSKGPKEIKVLHGGFSDLMNRANELLKKIRQEQEEKRQLELAVMNTQINPHFLYNTLYSIKGLSDMGLNKEASSMITALSNFFRISISKGQEIISIKDEIEHISNYLFIQEMRYGDDFSYEINVDPEIESYKIIKLTLQPLVENAIYHGVKQTRGEGIIQVNGRIEGEHICFEVTDNGAGISEEKLKEIHHSLENKHSNNQKIGFGLRSVHERIRIHYGNSYGLRFMSEAEKGTTAKVIIPKVKG